MGKRHYTEDSYGSGDDSDSSASSSASSMTSSSDPPPQYVDILFILYEFPNHDKWVSYGVTKTKICYPTPLPTAKTTSWLNKEANTTPPPSTPTDSDGSADANAAAAADGSNVSNSLGISAGSLTPMQSETQNTYSTKPTSGTPVSTSPTSSNSAIADQGSPSPPPPPPHHSSSPPVGALVVIPLVVIAALIGAFVVWRKKRRVCRAAAGMTQEMKMTRGPEDGLPQYTPAPTSNDAPLMGPPLMSLAATHTGTTTSLAPTASAAPSVPGTAAAGAPAEQPVILSSGMGGAYFTGIDTSDAVSMTSSSNHASSGAMHSGMASNRMSYDARSMTSADEPPPPYRPRSVPPISRETSLRQPNAPSNIGQMLAPLSEGALMGGATYEIEDFRVADGLRNPFEGGGSASSSPTIGEGMNNPFDDPDDASVISDNSTPVSPLVERDEGGHAAMGGAIPGARPGQEV